MKQRELVRAYNSLNEINRCRLTDGKLAMQIYKLKSKLQPIFDFQIQEEEKIFNEHPNFDPRLNGVVIGKDGVNRDEALNEAKIVSEELKKLADIDVDFEFEPFDFDLNAHNVPISGEDIENLNSFINFI